MSAPSGVDAPLSRPVGGAASALLAALLLASLIGAQACEDTTYSAAAAHPTVTNNGDNPAASAPLFFVGTDASGLQVVTVDVGGSEVASFGDALPVDPALYSPSALYVDAAGASVMVRLSADDGAPDLVVYGQGGAWTNPLAKLEGAEPFKVAPALDMIWAVTRLGPSRSGDVIAQVDVVTPEGEVLLEEPVLPWPDRRFAAFAPEGGWFLLLRDRSVLTLVRADGVETIVRTLPPQDGVVPRLIHSAFQTSLILVEPVYPDLRWVDLAGAPLEIEGFGANEAELDGRYAISPDGVVRQLVDRAVVDTGIRLIGEPSGSVVGHWQGRWLVTSTGTGLDVVDGGGESVASYVVEPSTAIAENLPATHRSASASVSGLVLSEQGGTALVRASHLVSDGDQIEEVEVTLDVWRFTDGTSTHTRIARLGPAAAYGAPRLTADAAAVLWVADGVLNRYDVEADIAEVLSDTLVFAPLVGRTPTTSGD